MRCKAGLFSGSANFQTSLLLHFDGTNGSTTFTDSSGASRTITGASSPEISTTQSKFGGSSLAVGPGYVYADDDAAFDFGSGDFTIELWYFDSTGDGGTLAAQWGYAWYLNTYQLYINGGLAIDWTAASSNAWHHIAVCRSGGTVTVFVDGSSVGTYAIENTAIDASSAFIGIGRDEYGNSALTGYIDEVRILKGRAAYSGTFTPPTTAFPNP